MATKLRNPSNGNTKGGILIGFEREHDAVINLVNEHDVIELQIISSNGGQIVIQDRRGDIKRTLDISDDTLGDA